LSLPSLGAWIETLYSFRHITPQRRSLHWERGLKLNNLLSKSGHIRRSLHWERGLKLLCVRYRQALPNVAPFIGSVD